MEDDFYVFFGLVGNKGIEQQHFKVLQTILVVKDTF